MKRSKTSMMIIFCVMVFVAMVFVPVALSENSVSIWGTISQRGTLITRVAEYNISDNNNKAELMKNVGQEVELVGTVTEAGGQRSINVISYQVLQQDSGDDSGGDD